MGLSFFFVVRHKSDRQPLYIDRFFSHLVIFSSCKAGSCDGLVESSGGVTGLAGIMRLSCHSGAFTPESRLGSVPLTPKESPDDPSRHRRTAKPS